jgi:hypothetical protein
MFVAFANIEEANALTEIEARQLHAETAYADANVTHRQVAKKIQRGWEQTGEVHLNDSAASAEHASVARGGRVLAPSRSVGTYGAPTRLACASVPE